MEDGLAQVVLVDFGHHPSALRKIGELFDGVDEPRDELRGVAG